MDEMNRQIELGWKRGREYGFACGLVTGVVSFSVLLIIERIISIIFN